MPKRKSSSIPTASISARELAVLTAELCAVGIIESSADNPHLLAIRFMGECDKERLAMLAKHEVPPGGVSALDVANTAVALAWLRRDDINDLPRVATRWLYEAHLALHKHNHPTPSPRESILNDDYDALRDKLKELNDYAPKIGERSYIPIGVIMRLAECAELKLTDAELAEREHTRESFGRLASDEKHLLRYDVLCRYEVELDVLPTIIGSGRKRELLKPWYRSVHQIRSEGGYELNLMTAESILGLMKAKEIRKSEVRREIRKRRTGSINNTSKQQSA